MNEYKNIIDNINNLYPDWRWGEFQKINPYKSLKLFKQNKFSDWHDTK